MGWEAVIDLAPFWRGQSGGLSRSGGPPNLAPAGRQSGGPNLARVWPIWRESLRLEIPLRNRSGEMPNLANAFSEVMFSQELKAPARNADPVTLSGHFGVSVPTLPNQAPPERGGRQNGQILARTAPARSAPDRKPDWRSRQIGRNARTARTPERQIDNSLPVLGRNYKLVEICSKWS